MTKAAMTDRKRRTTAGKLLGLLLTACLALLWPDAWLGPVTQPRAAAAERQPIELDVVTFNVLVDFAGNKKFPPWKKRRGLCVEVLRRVDPELIGFQETLPRQVQYLLKHLPGYTAIHEPGGYTDATIFYKTDLFELLDKGHWWLSPTPEKRSTGFGNFLPRVVVWVKLRDRATGTTFYFFNTHFDNTRPSQSKMAALCQQKLGPFMQTGLPLIFVGDFNTDQTRGDYPRLTSNGWRDAYLVSEHASPDGRDDNISTVADGHKRIDHIFYYGQQITPLKWERVESPDPETLLSDHYPVYARLRIE